MATGGTSRPSLHREIVDVDMIDLFRIAESKNLQYVAISRASWLRETGSPGILEIPVVGGRTVWEAVASPAETLHVVEHPNFFGRIESQPLPQYARTDITKLSDGDQAPSGVVSLDRCNGPMGSVSEQSLKTPSSARPSARRSSRREDEFLLPLGEVPSEAKAMRGSTPSETVADKPHQITSGRRDAQHLAGGLRQIPGVKLPHGQPETRWMVVSLPGSAAAVAAAATAAGFPNCRAIGDQFPEFPGGLHIEVCWPGKENSRFCTIVQSVM